MEQHGKDEVNNQVQLKGHNKENSLLIEERETTCMRNLNTDKASSLRENYLTSMIIENDWKNPKIL